MILLKGLPRIIIVVFLFVFILSACRSITNSEKAVVEGKSKNSSELSLNKAVNTSTPTVGDSLKETGKNLSENMGELITPSNNPHQLQIQKKGGKFYKASTGLKEMIVTISFSVLKASDLILWIGRRLINILG